MMDEQKFNELLELQKYDSDAKYEFCSFCLAVIKYRLGYRGEMKNVESLSHSILEYFLSHLPKSHIISPWYYLNKSVDNFLSNRKKKRKRILTSDKDLSYHRDIAYEQHFENLEKIEIYNDLVGYLGEENAMIFFLVKIEGEKECDVAEKLGINYETLRQRVSRSREKLEKILGKFVTKDD